MDGDSGESETFLTANQQYAMEDHELGEQENGIGDGIEDTIRDQDRFLPIANVARIMKNSVPRNGKIAKDAKECVQECVSEYISFITSEASERCHQEKRKTINGEDILYAMTTLGFDNYVEPLKIYLQKYRETTKGENKLAEQALVEDLDEPFPLGTSVLTTDPSQTNIIYTAYSTPTMSQANFLQ